MISFLRLRSCLTGVRASCPPQRINRASHQNQTGRAHYLRLRMEAVCSLVSPLLPQRSQWMVLAIEEMCRAQHQVRGIQTYQRLQPREEAWERRNQSRPPTALSRPYFLPSFSTQRSKSNCALLGVSSPGSAIGFKIQTNPFVMGPLYVRLTVSLLTTETKPTSENHGNSFVHWNDLKRVFYSSFHCFYFPTKY